MARITHAAAAAELADRDPVIAALVAFAGPPDMRRRPAMTHFASIVRAIAYQQLAGAAAGAIHGRFLALVDNDVTPERVLAVGPEAMRSVGLSTAKVASITDLAVKTLDGTVLLDARRVARLPDDDIVARLSTVRGIGRWTAEMFLMFQLQRLDVWPTGDLGVRAGYGLGWQVPTPSPQQLEALGEPFRPYRSVAAWYCWRAVERDRLGRAAPAAKRALRSPVT